MTQESLVSSFVKMTQDIQERKMIQDIQEKTMITRDMIQDNRGARDVR